MAPQPASRLDTLTVTQARAELGTSLVDELIAKFGPLLAEIILRWLMKRKAEHPLPEGVQHMSVADGRRFIAMLLRGNKDAVLGFIAQHLAEIYDLGVDWLDGAE